jgi:hypothetical protein
MESMDDKIYNSHYPIPFHCREKIGRNFEEWDGYIKRICNHGSHTEIYLESRSSMTFIIGNYTNGNFISIPSFKIGCDLSFEYCDYFWNNEHLAMLINKVDAATIAKALFELNKLNLI